MQIKRHDPIHGCLLGTAVGDAIGLPYEGMRPEKIAKLVGNRRLRHRFLFGRGMVSDDTDHSMFVAQALIQFPDDSEKFAKCLAGYLKRWLLCLPAGIGLATLKSLLKLWLGFGIHRSGVYSAGNGPAMRSAIIGARFSKQREKRMEFVRASTLLTHTDPKAEYGAQAVAAMAALVARNDDPMKRPSIVEVEQELRSVSDDVEWGTIVDQILIACETGRVLSALEDQRTAEVKGISGYVYQTVPVAIAAWWIEYGDFQRTVESAIRLGGDTDTVAAIAGGLAGASLGSDGIPEDWISGIKDWPHGALRIRQLSEALASGESRRIPFHWGLALRGILFTGVVLAHGFRRLLPPY